MTHRKKQYSYVNCKKSFDIQQTGRYLALVLHVTPYIQYAIANGEVWTPPLIACVSQGYLDQEHVDVLEWPTVCPDKNCIENLCALVSMAQHIHPDHKTTMKFSISQEYQVLHTSSMICSSPNLGCSGSMWLLSMYHLVSLLCY